MKNKKNVRLKNCAHLGALMALISQFPFCPIADAASANRSGPSAIDAHHIAVPKGGEGGNDPALLLAESSYDSFSTQLRQAEERANHFKEQLKFSLREMHGTLNKKEEELKEARRIAQDLEDKQKQLIKIASEQQHKAIADSHAILTLWHELEHMNLLLAGRDQERDNLLKSSALIVDENKRLHGELQEKKSLLDVNAELSAALAKRNDELLAANELIHNLHLYHGSLEDALSHYSGIEAKHSKLVDSHQVLISEIEQRQLAQIADDEKMAKMSEMLHSLSANLMNRESELLAINELILYMQAREDVISTMQQQYEAGQKELASLWDHQQMQEIALQKFKIANEIDRQDREDLSALLKRIHFEAAEQAGIIARQEGDLLAANELMMLLSEGRENVQKELQKAVDEHRESRYEQLQTLLQALERQELLSQYLELQSKIIRKQQLAQKRQESTAEALAMYAGELDIQQSIDRLLHSHALMVANEEREEKHSHANAAKALASYAADLHLEQAVDSMMSSYALMVAKEESEELKKAAKLQAASTAESGIMTEDALFAVELAGYLEGAYDVKAQEALSAKIAELQALQRIVLLAHAKELDAGRIAASFDEALRQTEREKKAALELLSTGHSQNIAVLRDKIARQESALSYLWNNLEMAALWPSMERNANAPTHHLYTWLEGQNLMLLKIMDMLQQKPGLTSYQGPRTIGKDLRQSKAVSKEDQRMADPQSRGAGKEKNFQLPSQGHLLP